MAKTYTVKSNLIHGGKLYEAGGPITIEDEELAADLLKRGIVVAGAPKPPKKEDEETPKT